MIATACAAWLALGVLVLRGREPEPPPPVAEAAVEAQPSPSPSPSRAPSSSSSPPERPRRGPVASAEPVRSAALPPGAAEAPRTVKIQGRVVDSTTGQPVAGLSISATRAADGDEATTDREGRFELSTRRRPTDRTVHVDVRDPARGYLEEPIDWPLGPGEVVDLGLVRVSPDEGDPTPQGERGFLGVNLTSLEGKVTFKTAGRNTPAGRAGVKRGDWLLGIDGQDVSTIGVGRARRLLRGSPGATKSLRVQTPGEPPRTVAVTFEPLPERGPLTEATP